MFQTNIIMEQDHINYLHNTNKDWCILIWRLLFQLIDQLWPKMGNPLASIYGFSLFLLILCFTNDPNKYYNDTGLE